MRADRLISLLILLQTEGPLSASELAQRLEVSSRTIYRDMDALSASGVPVYAERGRDGGYALLESYRTSLTGLKQEEVRALFMLIPREGGTSDLLANLGAEKALETARLKLIAAMPSVFRSGAQQVQQRSGVAPRSCRLVPGGRAYPSPGDHTGSGLAGTTAAPRRSATAKQMGSG